MIVDPVCGTILDDFEYPEVEEYEGRRYFFDSLECAQKFRGDPGKYAAGHKALGEPIAEVSEEE